MMVRMHTIHTSLKPLHRSLSLLRQIPPLNAPNTPPLNHLANIIIIRKLGLNTVLEVNLISDVHNLTANHRQQGLLSSDMLFWNFKVICFEYNSICKLSNFKRTDVGIGAEEASAFGRDGANGLVACQSQTWKTVAVVGSSL